MFTDKLPCSRTNSLTSNCTIVSGLRSAADPLASIRAAEFFCVSISSPENRAEEAGAGFRLTCPPIPLLRKMAAVVSCACRDTSRNDHGQAHEMSPFDQKDAHRDSRTNNCYQLRLRLSERLLPLVVLHQGVGTICDFWIQARAKSMNPFCTSVRMSLARSLSPTSSPCWPCASSPSMCGCRTRTKVP